MALSIALALGAGASYAVASVLQHRAASRQPPELSLSPRLIVALARRPLWLVGIAVDIGAYLLEAAALGTGSIIVVGPLLVSGLLFAIPLATFGTGRRVGRREMVPAILVTVGLAAFVGIGSPEGGTGHAHLPGWVLAGVVVAAIAGVCVGVGRRTTTSPAHRAMLFGVATGAIYGLTAVLTKRTVDELGGAHGVLGAFEHWPLYVLVAVSIVGLILNQSAFQAGPVAASLPAIAVVNPIVSATLGVVLFGEQLGAHGVLEIAATAMAVTMTVVGTLLLASSPVVAHE